MARTRAPDPGPPPTRVRPADATLAYALDVIEGRTTTGLLVRQACERHVADLAAGPARGLRWDLDEAERSIAFFPAVLRHSKGQFAGTPFDLLDWQRFVIGSIFGWKFGAIRRFRTAFVSTARKNGKMLANGTPIPTPDGWKPHGDLRAGDLVFGSHGRPVRVVAVTGHYAGPGYRVAFSDGTEIEAHARHEWSTEVAVGAGRRPRGNVETQAIAATLRRGARGELAHGIAVAPPLDTGADVSLPLPPHALGVWLGGGDPPGGTPATRAGFEGCLREMGVRDDKAVPKRYLRASVQQRRELLAGIVDGDGHVTPSGRCEVVLTNRELFDGVVELARTLGFDPAVTEGRATVAGVDGGPRFQMRFWPVAAELPVRTGRKRANLRTSPPGAPGTRMVVACDPCGQVTGQCIQVEGGVYLAGLGMVPTHNSTIEAGIGLKALVDEDEPGAEIYAAATTREQSRIVFSEAERMRLASPALMRRISSTTNNLAVLSTASWFRPLSSDSSKMDGLNVFVALVDELHEHATADVVEKLDTAMGARLQPLMYETTTAGVNRHTICYQHWDFSAKVLRGIIPHETADRWFAYVATVDEGDDWQDERVWHKANPSLGTLLKIEDLRAEVALAREMPSKQNSIRRLRLNQWTQQITRWLNMDLWDRAGEAIDPRSLEGRRCYGGLDLARVNDLSSLALLFPPVRTGERWKFLWQHWCPDEDIVERARRDRAPYPVWREQGWLVATEGNTTDFKFIEAAIVEAAGKYDIVDLAIDRTFAGEIVRNLMDEGVNVVEFGQGFMSMGPAAAEFVRKLLAGDLQHGGNPVATWCASNVTVRTDPAGNEKPDKERSTERIDAIVAAIMAVGRSMAGNPNESAYNSVATRLSLSL